MSAKEDFERLLIAAKTIQGWTTPAEIARQLTLHGYKTTDQIMTNWRNRGISAKGRLSCAHIIGCRAHWLETGLGEMTDAKPNYIKQTDTSPTTHLLGERHPVFFKLDNCNSNQLDKILALINAAEALSTSAPETRQTTIKKIESQLNGWDDITEKPITSIKTHK